MYPDQMYLQKIFFFFFLSKGGVGWGERLRVFFLKKIKN
jgi:hypothetical protein